MNESDGVGGIGRFLTIADTAEVLNLSPTETHDLITSGELPAIKVGGQWRIERAVLENYIEAKYEEARRLTLWKEQAAAAEEQIPDIQSRTRRS